MNLTCQCLKVESTKLIVDVKTSPKSSQILNLIKSFHWFLGIAQCNVDEMKNILQVKLFRPINKVFQKNQHHMRLEQNSTLLLFKCPPSNLYGVKNRLIKEDKIKNSSKKCTSTLIIAREPFKTRNSAEYKHACPR